MEEGEIEQGFLEIVVPYGVEVCAKDQGVRVMLESGGIECLTDVDLAQIDRILSEIDFFRGSIGEIVRGGVGLMEYKEERSFLQGLQSRVSGVAPLMDFDPELANKVMDLYESKIDQLSGVARRFVDNYRWANPIQYESAEQDALLTFSSRRIIDTLYALSVAGVMDEARPVQLHSFCGGDGMDGFIAQAFREGHETFFTCHDNSPRGQKEYEYLKNYAFCTTRGSRFELGDISKAKFFKRGGAMNAWIIQNPSSATKSVTERMARLSPEEMPDAVVMAPCACCSYDTEYYPDDGYTEITKEEWTRLNLIIHRNYSLPSPGTQGEGNLGLATRLADLIRASYINRQNRNMSATVCVTPGADRGQNLIYMVPRK